MRASAAVLLVVLLGNAFARRFDAQTRLNATATPSSATPSSSAQTDPVTWMFPVAKLNESLPEWFRLGGEFRTRLEGPIGIGYTPTSDFDTLIRFRLHATIKPTDWLRFHAEVQDAQIFFNHHIPNANPYEDKWTLWEGYAQVGNPKDGWVDALAGREVLLFGDERVIGPSNWTNVSRTFDVARVNFHHAGNNVSVFASSVVPGEATDLHNALPGNNLYGVYGSFVDRIVPKSTFEPYVLWSVAPSSSELPDTLNRGHLNEVTMGLHWKGDLPKGFDYDTEFDGQTGSLGASPIRAWAGYAGIGKTFSKIAWSPRPFAEGNYASGTKNPNGHNWNTFDQIYPSNHDKLGFADVAGRRNIEHFRVGVEEEPTKKWKLKEAFESYWLVTSNDNFYANSGAISVVAHPGAPRHVGTELDLVAEYQLNKGLSFGFGVANLFTGPFLNATTQGHDYTYPYAYFEYNFSQSGFHFPVTINKRN